MKDQDGYLPRFDGLDPWPAVDAVGRQAGAVYYLSIGGERIDLHGASTFVDFSVTCDRFVTLTLRFRVDDDGRDLRLVFFDVRDLRFAQDTEAAGADWNPVDVSTFDEIEYWRDPRSGSCVFRIGTIIGELQFVCDGEVTVAVGEPRIGPDAVGGSREVEAE
ncbi:hypothetical protein AB0I28_27135 [Phytomonospora sp. NPDC050363]|uniref:hypothetical protein n=1 Tax=Phytomonospora sp. NPDC050363 TaxID=3155642 RepID=UPI0033EB7F1F